jgi:3-isopropylmalate/(R)-2-methylmalate dehydratase large subunit
MGKTIVEKILSEHCNKNVKAGELVTAKIDVVAIQDKTENSIVEELKKINPKKIVNRDRTILCINQISSGSKESLSTVHKALREFAQKSKAVLYEIGEGICNQKLVEDHVNPGEFVVGVNSHTCTSGAMGAFAIDINSTDLETIMTLGQISLQVPKSIKININGKMQPGVYSKDLILYIISLIGSDSAKNKAIEFTGETIKDMNISNRLTLCNMAVESGAQTGIIASDEYTRDYLFTRGRGNTYREIKADTNAVYERVIEINASTLKPTVSCPNSVDNIMLASKLSQIKVDQVFIGSCTNGRIEDLRIAAQILKDKRVNENTRLLIIPASREIFLEALKEGLIRIFAEAGAFIASANCGPCSNNNFGILADDEVCLSTQNRNYQEKKIYLCSPATAAISAVTGHITDPRETMAIHSTQRIYPFERYIS